VQLLNDAAQTEVMRRGVYAHTKCILGTDLQINKSDPYTIQYLYYGRFNFLQYMAID